MRCITYVLTRCKASWKQSGSCSMTMALRFNARDVIAVDIDPAQKSITVSFSLVYLRIEKWM